METNTSNAAFEGYNRLAAAFARENTQGASDALARLRPALLSGQPVLLPPTSPLLAQLGDAEIPVALINTGLKLW